jgi:Holliday junction DNA helicase RuvA
MMRSASAPSRFVGVLGAMIGRLTGTVVECTPNALVLDVGGVGYALQIPLSTFYAVRGHDAAPVSLHVHTHVREDSLLLFGFATREERSAFEHLISVSGIGPRTALAVLSGIGAADLERAILESDRESLESIPGIGRKTAERVILELKDKLDRSTGAGRRGASLTRSVPEPLPSRGLRADAVSALENLGYRRDAAARSVDAALRELGEEAPIDELLKGSLRKLVR